MPPPRRITYSFTVEVTYSLDDDHRHYDPTRLRIHCPTCGKDFDGHRFLTQAKAHGLRHIAWDLELRRRFFAHSADHLPHLPRPDDPPPEQQPLPPGD